MTDQPRTFSQTKARLEEIVTQVRKKDTSLEKSLDLLEEGVKLANQCTELIDHADWESAEEAGDDAAVEGAPDTEADGAAEDAGEADAGGADDENATEMNR